jgi:hypothetical protein
MTRFLMLSILASACGGSTSDQMTDGKPPPTDATSDAPPAKLACNSAALCTTYDVNTFLGTVPAPAGGTVRSGLYRLAWKLIPDNVGETGGYHDELESLETSGSGYRHAAFFNDELGTFQTTGTTITFNASQYCDRGNDGDPSTNVREYKYTATATELDLFSTVTRSDGVTWQQLSAYVLTASPMDVCKTVAMTPPTPGDSAQCRVSNCACEFALNGTVPACD